MGPTDGLCTRVFEPPCCNIFLNVHHCWSHSQMRWIIMSNYEFFWCFSFFFVQFCTLIGWLCKIPGEFFKLKNRSLSKVNECWSVSQNWILWCLLKFRQLKNIIHRNQFPWHFSQTTWLLSISTWFRATQFQQAWHIFKFISAKLPNSLMHYLWQILLCCAFTVWHSSNNQDRRIFKRYQSLHFS